jgi:hypothetical protein
MITKPDDITDEHFELMVNAMLAFREVHLEYMQLPSSMSPRAKPFRDAIAKGDEARMRLIYSFDCIDYDEDEDEEAAE